MKFVKTILIVLAADVLSLFIGLTLAGSAALIMRIISAVCTSGILVCLLSSFAMKEAASDAKNARISGEEVSKLTPVLQGCSASLIGLVSWVMLLISLGGGFDFYRWHKLLNGWFLQIYNLINADASSSALAFGEVMLMLPLAILPTVIFIIAYNIGAKKKN